MRATISTGTMIRRKFESKGKLIFTVFAIIKISESLKVQNASCTLIENTNTCFCYKYNQKLEEICSHQKEKVHTLEIRHIYALILSLKRLLEKFENISNITISKGKVCRLSEILPPNNNIRVLQLKDVGLMNITKKYLQKFENLEILDLSGNYLKTFYGQDLYKPLKSLKTVRLTNNHWNCSVSLDWVLNVSPEIFNDLEQLKCYGEPYAEKPLYQVAKFANNMRINCPQTCDCRMPDIVKDPNSSKYEAIIEVNCTDRGLTQPPSILPTQTKILILSKNRIENLEFLANNSIYRHVQDIYLDNNLIRSIAELEGVYWLAHFRVLSLRYNRVMQLPTYALDNALQQNPNMPNAVRIYLGHNPWRCDCVYLPRFQDLLRKYELQIRDKDDIRCPSVEGNSRSFKPILRVTRSSVCQNSQEYIINFLDLLNGILASMIIFILAKLAYDYYYYKKSGKLPWIATRLP